MSISSDMMGFAHYSADKQQLRYQRNTRIMSDNRMMEMDRRVWYQPFIQLTQPLIAPRSVRQFDNISFHGANQSHLGHIPMASMPLHENFRNQITPQMAPAFTGQDFVASQDDTIKVISMDEDTTVHGNWTLKNAKFRLSCFCEANGHSNGYIFLTQEDMDENTKKRNWIQHCRKALFLNQLGKNIKAESNDVSKEVACQKCALSLIQHLYQLQLIEAHIAPVKLRKKKESQMEIYKVVVYKVTLQEKLERELDEVLKMMKINPYVIPQRELVKTKPFILKTQKVLTVSEITASEELCIPQWSPPFITWDPWLNRRITEGTLVNMSMGQISRDLRKARFHQIESDSTAQQMLNDRLKLPIFKSISKIMDAIQNNPVVIIQGPNGCGKSTQVPQYILDTYINAGRGGECSIIVIQPRRVSTISIAERVVQERGETMGSSCGYSMRFDSWLPRPYGSILFCTADVVLKKLKSGLRGISHVIVDEIQERDINIDFILSVLNEMMRKYYNLRVILLSAPADTTLFCEYFSNCPVIEVSTGQSYAVTDYYLEDCIEMVKFVPKKIFKLKSSNRDSDDEYSDENMNKVIGKNYLKTTAEAMGKVNEEEIPFELIEALLTYINFLNVPGAILIFLPGWNAVSELMNRLRQHLIFSSSSYLILPLHSQLSRQEVRQIFEPAPLGVTKVILSSSIGECGITINDVVYVIDSCKIKLKHFNSHEVFFNSAIVWASKRNLEQRKGRAGRTQNGTCFRLCSRARFEKLKDDMPAAITYTPLDELALAIKFLRLGSVYHFLSQALQPPPLYLILQAETLLREIGATNVDGQLTSLGFILGQLPIRPQLGKMLILSCLFLLGDPFCTITPRTSICMELFDPASLQQLSYARQHFQGNHCSDFITLLNAFTQWEKAQNHGKLAGNYFCEEYCFSKSAMEITKNAKRQLKGILQAAGFPGTCMSEQDYISNESDVILDMISALLLVGYYPNICYYNIRTKEILINGNVVAVDSSSLYHVKEAMQFSKSPFFVFEERIHTKTHCKEMTMVTPLQLLLFGHSRVEIIDGIVVLDGWIKLKMKMQLASQLLALRSSLEAVLLQVAYNPSLIESSDVLHHLVNVVKKLCSRNTVARKEQSAS